MITISAELNDAEEDYRVRYTEAKSVLDNIADWRRNLNQPTSFATPTAATVTTALITTPFSVPPTVSVATPHVQTSPTKTPSVDGAKAPSLTADGSSRVQTKIPYSAPSTSVQVSTYRIFYRFQHRHQEPLNFDCRPLSLQPQELGQKALISLLLILLTQHR